MTRAEVINTLVEYLDQHLKNGRGYMGQSPYRDDFFKFFRGGLHSGLLRTLAEHACR